MALDDTCIFCRIIRGEVPSFQVCEDERSLAFMDLNPANPGHVLVIPKVHAVTLFALDDPTEGMTAFVAKRKANFTNR